MSESYIEGRQPLAVGGTGIGALECNTMQLSTTMRLRLVLLALNWMSAFLIVMALFLGFGDELRDLPLAYRALAISGVLSVSMSQVVGPLLNRLVRAVLVARVKR